MKRWNVYAISEDGEKEKTFVVKADDRIAAYRKVAYGGIGWTWKVIHAEEAKEGGGNMSDFILNPAGMNLVILVPVTDAAKEFVDENIEVPDYASDMAIPVEPRYVDAIIEGINEAGLTIN